ncbi:hypothetical protein ACIOEW_32155 [Streptomyces sp. NPDC087901]|uniref:hypothetical protein n=1 Tax=Streptomyces sp. NPDC087901 TaxID=3365818 RepID=UPI0037F5B044
MSLVIDASSMIGSYTERFTVPGLAALTQWVEREGADRAVPRGRGEPIAVDGEAQPVIVKLGVWISNTRARREKLAADQLAAIAALDVDWA